MEICTNKFASGNFFVCVCFFEIKNIYFHTHLTDAGGYMIKKFSPGQFPETRPLFFGLINNEHWNNLFNLNRSTSQLINNFH